MLGAPGTVCRSSRFSSRVLPSSKLSCLASSRGVSSCAETHECFQSIWTSHQAQEGMGTSGDEDVQKECWRSIHSPGRLGGVCQSAFKRGSLTRTTCMHAGRNSELYRNIIHPGIEDAFQVASWLHPPCDLPTALRALHWRNSHEHGRSGLQYARNSHPHISLNIQVLMITICTALKFRQAQLGPKRLAPKHLTS